MKIKSRVVPGVLAALAAALLAGCSGAQTITNRLTGPCSAPVGYSMADWSPSGDQIVFDAYTSGKGGGKSSVQVMDAAGKNVRQLTADGSVDGPGAWSPDGRQIVFRSSQDGNPELYAINVDPRDPASPGPAGSGSGQKRLTNNLAYDKFASWSPDGSRIAFVSELNGGVSLHVMAADGTGEIKVAEMPFELATPAWSPDSAAIVFMSRQDGNLELYRVSADGSEEARLTHDPGTDASPAWSPDGKRIAFQSNRDGVYAVYVMDADGGNQTRLTTENGGDYQPVWSPDPGGAGSGKKIAFVSNRDGNQEIYVMDADGSNQVRLTDSPRDDNAPVWSPDPGGARSGTRIAFISWRDNNSDIFVMNADPGAARSGSGVAQLTVNPAKQRCLQWPF